MWSVVTQQQEHWTIWQKSRMPPESGARTYGHPEMLCQYKKTLKNCFLLWFDSCSGRMKCFWFVSSDEAESLMMHITSACESGWDFSTRWAGQFAFNLQVLAWASEGFFPGGGSLEDFSKNLQGGTKSREICFFSLKAKKTTFLLKISKSRGLPFQRPYVLVRHTRTPATALDLFIRLLPCKRFVYKNASFPTFSCN